MKPATGRTVFVQLPLWTSRLQKGYTSRGRIRINLGGKRTEPAVDTHHMSLTWTGTAVAEPPGQGRDVEPLAEGTALEHVTVGPDGFPLPRIGSRCTVRERLRRQLAVGLDLVSTTRLDLADIAVRDGLLARRQLTRSDQSDNLLLGQQGTIIETN